MGEFTPKKKKKGYPENDLQVDAIKRKVLALFILNLFTLTLFILLFVPLFNVSAAEKATVKVDSLNVREGPSLSHSVITEIKKNETFPIIQKKEQWIQLQLSDKRSGWVASWLVSQSKEPTIKQIRPTVDSLRVRGGPGTNYQQIGSLSKDDVVEQIDENANWVKINYNNSEGWLAASYVTEVIKEKKEASKSKHEETKQVRIDASILNVRKEPNLSATIIGKLKEGTILPYRVFENGWYSIKIENGNGWISGDFATVVNSHSSPEDDKTSTIVEKPDQLEMVVSASILNIRNKPSLDGEIVTKIKDGTIVTILEEKEKWSKISINGETGWAFKKYLQKQDQAKPKVTILHDGTNIRHGPSTSTDVVQRANKGDSFSIVKKEGNWYKIKRTNGGSAYIAGWIVKVTGQIEKVKQPGVEEYLRGKTIVIDPGHGGKDNGTTGISGTLEKVLTYRTAKLLADKLKASGAKVILTRNGDYYVTLQYRVSLSHYYGADAFISIHYDSSRYESVNGISTYYYDKNQDAPLANIVQNELIKNTGLNDRKTKYGNFHVLRENKQPSILLELGFLSNKRNEWVVNSNDFQEKSARAIFKGLVTYFKE